MSNITIFGAIIALAGLVAFAVPSFNTEQTQDVAKVGSLKLQEKTEQTHYIPPLVSGGAIILGVVLIGAGLVTNRE